MLSIKPFIITRPVADIIVSLRDHFMYDFEQSGRSYLYAIIYR